MKALLRAFLGKYRLLCMMIRNTDVKVGSNFFCASGCFISAGRSIQIGNNFYMGHRCHIGCHTVIGNDVMFASNVALVGGDHKIDFIDGPIRNSGRDEIKTISIGDGAWVGHGAIIMHGVTIGKGAVVAAGSIVTKDVEPMSIVGGNPAKVIRYRKQC